MPSPPMVSGPLTRIDRLTTIQATWGQDLVGSGDNRYGGCRFRYPIFFKYYHNLPNILVKLGHRARKGAYRVYAYRVYSSHFGSH